MKHLSSPAEPREVRAAKAGGALTLAVCYVVLVLWMILAASPERYDLSVSDIAQTTITATKDVVDEATTALNRDRAAAAVQPVYQEDENALVQVMDDLENVFIDFEAIREFGESLRADPAYANSFTREQLDRADALCEKIDLSDWQLNILLKLASTELSAVYVNTVNAVTRAMESTIREGQLETALQNIQRQIIQYTSSDLCWNIAMPAVRACIVPNMIVNQTATDENREAARQAIEPSYYKSGQNIVVAGERVTSAQIQVLEALGLLEGNRFDVKLMAGVAVLGALVMVALVFHILQFEREAFPRVKNALMLAFICLLSFSVCYLCAQINPYFIPFPICTLLVAALISPSLAVICNSLTGVVLGVLVSSTHTAFAQQMLTVVVACVLSGPVGIYVVRRRPAQRGAILAAGLLMALVDCAGVITIGLLTNNNLREIADRAVWSVGGAVLASVLCLGIQPALEWLFNLTTPFKLIEMANPNQPLLRRLLVETPGTYHHSVMVANMAEAAAEAIGANALLTRVGAYYHDVGKLKRPLYFKENQLGDNPHDRTDPRVSAAIITEHVADGVQLAREARLPEPIIDLIAQHHGDTPVAYFYHKMLSEQGGEGVRMEDFRYQGPKPQTREAAILMLADTAEAAVRAGSDQTPDNMEKSIRGLVKGKLDDGQLNEAPITFRDVNTICDAFLQVLNGIYHKRIEYPKLDSVPQPPPLPPEPPEEEEERDEN